MHLADAVGALLAQRSMRIHYLPGRPEAFYTVRAPSLLAQLADAVESSSSGSGGRTVPGSRLPVNTDVLQLWLEIHMSVHGWAEALKVDRRPYLPRKAERYLGPEGRPRWMRALEPWLKGVAWDEALPEKYEPLPMPDVIETSVADLRASAVRDQGDKLASPALGRLLRSVAAAAVKPGSETVASMMARRAIGWAHQIEGMLAVTVPDRELRGASCPWCRTETVDPVTGTRTMQPTTTALEERDGELYRVPAIVVRVAQLFSDDPDDLWIYRMCRACGGEGWLDYTTRSDEFAA